MNSLAFPQLGIEFTVKRYFEIFGFKIYWYGVIIAVGFLLALIYCMRRAAKYQIKQSTIIDVALISLPSAIVGCRIMYVLCNLDEFKGNFWSVFAIWKGGIAIYGGLVLAITCLIFYCAKKKVNVWNLFDLAVLGLLIGQIIGRWGNFINGEAYGIDVENFFLGMSINGGVDVHPIFLYESVWNLIGFLLLHFQSKKRMFNGQIFLEYVVWYGIGRGLIEGIRAENVLMISLFGTQFRISQLIAFASAFVCAAILIYKILFTDRSDAILLLSDEEANAFRKAEKAEEERLEQERMEKRNAKQIEDVSENEEVAAESASNQPDEWRESLDDSEPSEKVAGPETEDKPE